jgi:Putative S-adenosyl-L-methionine-dependent methyltransferase
MDRDPGAAGELGRADPTVLERARRLGPLPYSALGAGPPAPSPRSLSTESPQLASWVAAAIDGWWTALGRPDPYKVVEVGAGDGSRASQVLGMGPECLNALRYVLVDRGFRDAQASHLPIESPAFLFPGGSEDPDDLGPDGGDRVSGATGMGPLVTSLEELPALRGDGAVIAVGWLSRLPSDRVEWREGRWWEIRLAARGVGLVEMAVPLVDGDLGGARGQVWRRATPASRSEGARYAVLAAASDWISGALRVAESGILAIIDSWTPTTEPLGSDGRPAMALDQFSPLRRPLDSSPHELFEGLSVVSWRLG